MKNQFYRTCVVYDFEDDKEYYAIFHRFEKESQLVFERDYADAPVSAVVSKVYGVVEFEDGQIRLVDPEFIRFVDGFAERIVRKFRTEEKYDD